MGPSHISRDSLVSVSRSEASGNLIAILAVLVS